MKLLLDEDSEARVLALRLAQAGHDVVTVGDLGQSGAPDEVILQLAQTANRVFLNRNCPYFNRLHQDHKLRPAQQSINRLTTRARRLHEQGADLHRLRQYVWRWYRWLQGGLRGRGSTKGRFTRVRIRVLKQLSIAKSRIWSGEKLECMH